MSHRPRRQLLIIAPSLFETHRAAVSHGLDPKAMTGTRAITSAYALRGILPGTPFITINRDSWSGTERGFDLDRAVTALQRSGRLRPAAEDDLEAVCRTAPAGAGLREGGERSPARHSRAAGAIQGKGGDFV